MAKKNRIMPLFPLPDVVLFPGSPLPLHIFEPRYRQMINTIMEGDKTFGVLLYEPEHSHARVIGSSAVVTEIERLPDGRMNLMAEGERRFRVVRTIEDLPYLQGEVEWLDDKPNSKKQTEVEQIQEEVMTYIKDILRLSSKINNKLVELPEDLPTDPMRLSFWVAGTMYSVPKDQQALLELQDTYGRLVHEAKVLSVTTKFLAARSALKDAVG